MKLILKSIRGLCAVIIVPLAFATLTGCNSSVVSPLTQQNLDKVQNDMTSAQVKAILGEPTDSKTEPIPIVGGTKTTYDYDDSKGDHVTIILKNDTVQSKEGNFANSQ